MRVSTTAGAETSEGSIRWVFLDRDGTLNVKPPPGEYIERPEVLELLPGAAEAVATLNRAGVWTGVVTNQRGVALGRMTVDDLNAVHDRLRSLLQEREAFLDAIYACPHEVGICDCRKPSSGLLLQAQRQHPALEFARSAIVGDSLTDVEAGRTLGLATALISDQEVDRNIADHVVPDVLHAVRCFLSTPAHGRN